MPKYRVQDPDSGLAVFVDGDSPPTEEELTGIFEASFPKTTKTATEPAFNEKAAQTAVNAATGITSSILGILNNPSVSEASSMGQQQVKEEQQVAATDAEEKRAQQELIQKRGIIPTTGEQSTTYGGPPKKLASYAETMESLQEADTALAKFIAPRQSPMEPRITIPTPEELHVKPDDGFWVASAKESINALKGVPEFFTSDVGILSLLANKLAPAVVSLGFSADLTKSAFEQAGQHYVNFKNMTPAEKGVATVQFLSTLMFAGMTATHGGKRAMDELVPARELAREINKGVKNDFAPLPEKTGPKINETSLNEPDYKLSGGQTFPLIATQGKIEQADAIKLKLESANASLTGQAFAEQIGKTPVSEVKTPEKSEKTDIEFTRVAPTDDLSLFTHSKLKSSDVIGVKKTTNDSGKTVYAIRYTVADRAGEFVGYSDNPIWELHDKFGSGFGESKPIAIEPKESVSTPIAEPTETVSTPVAEPKGNKQVSQPDQTPTDFDIAERTVREKGIASLSLLQRENRWPHARAEAAMAELEQRGVVGPKSTDGSARVVLPPHPDPAPKAAKPEIKTPSPTAQQPVVESVPEGGKGETKEVVAPENPYDTSATSARLTDLQKSKPRPINKLYGPNPTPEQVSSQTKILKDWNREYRKAQKAHKETVAKSNEWLRQQEQPKPEAAVENKETGVVDTIAGKMGLTEFENKGYTPEQVTKQNWIDLQRAERRRLGQQEGGDSKNAPNSEYEEYHKQAVKDALARGEEVDLEVIKDYPDLKKPAAVESPKEAITKIQKEVKAVTSTEGKRSAKAIKADLISKLQESLKSAPDVQEGSITINIPGDGDFTIKNSKTIISSVLESVKSINTRGVSDKAAKTTAGKLLASEYLKRDIKDAVTVYGNESNAYQRLNSQLLRAEALELEPEQIKRLKKLVGAFRERIESSWKKAAEQLEIARDSYESGSKIESDPVVQKKKQRIAELEQEVAKERMKADAILRISEEGKSVEKSENVAVEPEVKPTEEPAKPIGMGGAVSEEFVPSDKATTATKNAAVDRDLMDRGEPPMMDALRKSDPELWAQAMAEIDSDWQAADKLIARHRVNPFLPSDVQTMILLQRRVDLKNEYNKANREMVLAQQEGRTEAAENARAVADDINTKLLELDQITGKGETAQGTMLGRAFRARQLVMNEDYSMGSLVPEMTARFGRSLNKDEMVKLQKISDDNARYAAEMSELVSAYEKNQAIEREKKILERVQKDIKSGKTSESTPKLSETVLRIAEEIVTKWEKRAELADKRLKDRLTRMSAGIDPTIVLDLATVGLAKFGRAALSAAKFAEEMLAKYGPKIEPYIEPAYEKMQELVEQERKGNKTGVRAVEKARTAKAESDSPEDVVGKSRESIQQRLEKKLGIKYYVNKLARYFVEQGETDPAKLVDKLTEVVQSVDPSLTRDQVSDIQAGYGPEFLRELPSDYVSRTLRDLNGQLQQLASLRRMAEGKAPYRSGFVREAPSAEKRQLMQQVEAGKRKGGYTVTDPKIELKTALEKIETRLLNQMEDMQRQIDKGEKTVKEKFTVQLNDSVRALKAARDDLRAYYESVFKKPDLTEEQRLDLWKEKAREKIEMLKERVESRDISTRKKPDPVRLDPEAININFELHKVHRALMDMRQKAEQEQWSTSKKLTAKAANLIRFSRAVITGGEFSAVLRQGAFSAFSHPLIAAKSIMPMFRALRSEKNQFSIMKEILTRDNAPLYQKSNLELTETGMRLSNMEEHYMFSVFESLKNSPGFKETFGLLKQGDLKKGLKASALYLPSKGVHVTEAFQRAYTTYLNKLRADTFDHLASVYGKDPQTAKDIANLINVATGRGTHSLGRHIGSGLNTMFFAPRYSISRFQLLAGQPFWSAKNKKMIATEYARALIGASVVYSLGVMAGGSVNVTDPTSSDFLKIKLGDTRIDPLAGLIQATVLLSKLATGVKTKLSGRQASLTGEKMKYGQDDIRDEISRFLWNKGAPLPNAIVNLRQGHDNMGQPYGKSEFARDMASPITYRDVYKAMEEQGIPRGTILSILAMFGMGVSTYQ